MEFHLEGHKLIGPVRQLHAARSLLLHLIFSWQQKQDENNQPRKASVSDWLLKNLQGILSSEGYTRSSVLLMAQNEEQERTVATKSFDLLHLSLGKNTSELEGSRSGRCGSWLWKQSTR